MFFVVSKIVYTLVAPSSLCLLALSAGLALAGFERYRRLGWQMAVGGLVALVIFGISPFGKWISLPLEERFAGAEPPAVAVVTHIIVLGGGEQAGVSRARGQLATNSSGERILALPALARRYLGADIVFTGGYGWLLGEPISAAADVARYLGEAGVAPHRIVLESRSQNTWQNARFVKEELAKRARRCPCGYLIVTSAWHMPRAIGIFRQAGFEDGEQQLFAWPVDYRTEGGADTWQPFRWLHEGLRQTDLAVKEWIGLAVYWASGRSSSIWPGPHRKKPHKSVR